MASEKKVKPKTWRIFAKNDARSTPFEQLGNLLRMRQFGPSCITRIYFARVVAGALNS